MWQQMRAGSGANIDRVFCRESGGEGKSCALETFPPHPRNPSPSTEWQNGAFPKAEVSLCRKTF